MTTIPQSLRFSEFLSFGWNILQDNVKTLLKFFVLYIVLLAVPNIIVEQLKPSVLSVLFSLALTIWQIVLSMGMMKLSLNIIDGKEVSFDTLLEPKNELWTYLLGTLRVGIQVFIGFLLLIVPGIIWAIQYQFVPWLIIDKKMSVSDALAKSTEMTNGKKMDLFLFGLGFAVINIAGALLLGIGLLITIPVTSFAMVGLYRSLLGGKKSTSSAKLEEGKVVA